VGHIVQCRPHPTAAQKRRLRCQESGQARSCCALAAACASKRFSGICIISPRVGVRTRRERRGDPGRNETGSHSRTRGSRRQQLHHFLEKSTFARLSNSPTLEVETKTLRIWTWGGAPSSNPSKEFCFYLKDRRGGSTFVFQTAETSGAVIGGATLPSEGQRSPSTKRQKCALQRF
jgi:hypothetical protein